MTIRRAVLQVEELGQRVLPSVSPVTVHVTAPIAAAIAQPHHHVVGGQGHGVYTTGPIHPDTGTQYHLLGRGNFAGLGKVDIAGDVYSVGFIFHGRAVGTMMFRNSHGSVNIELTGPSQDAFSSLPNQFHYHVTGGTGAYKHAHGDGTLQLNVTAASLGHGTFTVKI